MPRDRRHPIGVIGGESHRGRARIDALRAAGERGITRARELPAARPLIDSFEREQGSGAGLLAGGLAYRLFFWLVAFGLLVAAIASFWVRSDEGSLQDAAKSFGLSGVAARSAASAVEDGSNARWYLLASGLVLIVYFGIGAVRALRVAAFIAWQLKPTRLRRPLTASVVFTATAVAGLGTTMFTSWVRENAGAVGLLVTLAALAIFVLLAALVFTLLPRAEGTTWMSLLPGAVFAGLGITGVHLFVVYFLSDKLERSPKLYGTLGAATVVLLGLYLIARVVVSAMFLNATLHRLRITPSEAP